MFWDKAYRLMKSLTEFGVFLLVWVIAGALIFALGNAAWELIKPKHDEVKIEAKISDKKDGKSEITLKVGQIEKYGNLWVARIQEPKESYRVDYHTSRTVTRNLLLSSSKSNQTHIIFDSYKNNITEFKPLPENNTTKVFVCSYIKNYTDSMDEENTKVSLMLIDKNAGKQKTIIEDADRVLKTEMVDDNAVSVIYLKEGKLISANYSLEGFKATATPAIFDLKDTSLRNSELLIGEIK